MKKAFNILILSLLITIVSLINCLAYNTDVKVFVNDKILPVSAIEKDGYSLAPLRAYFEALGYTVKWHGESLSVTATKENSTIKMVCNDTTAYLNESAVAMPCPMIEIDGTTYAPVRSVAEMSGLNVSWIDMSRTAVITDETNSIEFYPNSPSLMPMLETVLDNVLQCSSGWTDENTGIYYKYEGLTENDALKYGELLELNYDFKYDSMQLGENYSKHYIYVNNRTTAMISVESDGIYIFPSVASDYAFEPLKTDSVTQTAPEAIAPPENESLQDTQPENAPEYEYYENTDIPEFGYVTGCTFITESKTESGYPVYAYYGSMIDIMQYMSHLTNYCGFSGYSFDTSPFDMTMTYTCQKDDLSVVAVYKMMSGTVYISYGN